MAGLIQILGTTVAINTATYNGFPLALEYRCHSKKTQSSFSINVLVCPTYGMNSSKRSQRKSQLELAMLQLPCLYEDTEDVTRTWRILPIR